MNSFLVDAATLIIQVAFGLYIFAVLLRFLFQLARVDFYNPISQFLVAFTNPLLKPLRRIIPGLFGIDLASVVLLLLLQSIQTYLIFWLTQFTPEPLAVFLAAIVELLRLTLNIYFYAVLLRVILSWFMPYGMRHNPAGNLLAGLTDPLMRPAQRLIPPVGGLDLSPIVVLVVLQLLLLAMAHLLH